MNTEQAFIEGFVKRASEYGLDESQANSLLKEAVRGQRAYALMNGVGKDMASQALKNGISSASPFPNRHVVAPDRGSMSADVLAALTRQVRQGIKVPPSNPVMQNNLNEMQRTGKWMMNPTKEPWTGDRVKAMNTGINLLGDASPWKPVA